jgi:hypothetical protein
VAAETLRLVDALLVVVFEGRSALPRAKVRQPVEGERSSRAVIDAIRNKDTDAVIDAVEQGLVSGVLLCVCACVCVCPCIFICMCLCLCMCMCMCMCVRLLTLCVCTWHLFVSFALLTLQVDINHTVRLLTLCVCT